MVETSTLTAPDAEPDDRRAERPRPLRDVAARVVCYGLLVGIPLAMTLPMESELLGGLSLVLVLLLIFMKVPVGIALTAPSLWTLFLFRGGPAVEGTLASLPYSSVASWSLSVIPLFVFMGLMLWRSGATSTLYDLATRTLGRLPGGLAIGTNVAGAGLATVSGDTLGTTYALGRVGVPEMLKAGYDPRVATASVLMAGNMGHLIPPSIFMTIYAGVANVPVGPQLMAGLIPGVVLLGLYVTGIMTVGLLRPSLVGRGRYDVVAAERQGSLGRTVLAALPVLALMVVVVYCIYSGVTTATEAAAIGTAGAFLIGAASLRGRFLPALSKATRDTVATTAGIFLVVMGASMLTRVIAVSGLARWAVEVVADLGLGRVSLMLLLIVVYLVMGMFMSPLVMMLVTVPILLPVLDEIGVSTQVFGVFVVLLCELAFVTPPVGMLLYVMHRLVQDPEVSPGRVISLRTVMSGVLWSLPLSVTLLVLLIFFPGLAEWLPGRME